tara:strand:- start:14887 stop:15363 length:477 start_codon:yes stop_codon:yes gene_type:complete
MAPTFKMPKKMNQLLNNEMLVLGAGVLLVFFIVNYSQSKSAPPAPAPPRKKPKNVGPSPGGANGSLAPPPAARPTPSENKPADLLPHDGNSEWAEFAPQGQGDLQGSGSLLHPQISQRPFNAVQGTNALRGDPQIAIGEVPSIAAPSNPVHGNHAGLN